MRSSRPVSFVYEHARRFFTNTRGINNILYVVVVVAHRASRIASSSSSSLRTHGSRASTKGGSFAAASEEEGEHEMCPNVREIHTLGYNQPSFHFLWVSVYTIDTVLNGLIR